MLRDYLNCKEYFRWKWLENKVANKPSIHQHYGKAVHLAAEAFWQGKDYLEAYAIASEEVRKIDLEVLNAKERNKLDAMIEYLPDLLAVYFEANEQETQNLIEYEWIVCWACQHQHFDGNLNCRVCDCGESVFLCGRIDRYSNGKLWDLKTASEIGKTWKRDYKEASLRDIGLSLYDWYLCEQRMPPTEIAIEVLIKPYKDKKARYEVIDLNEIIAYRERFKQQLSWVVPEMVHYIEKYGKIKPWPMNAGGQCLTKYGPCPYLLLCNHGVSTKNMSQYKEREEHLEVRK